MVLVHLMLVGSSMLTAHAMAQTGARVLFDAAHHNWQGEEAWAPMLDLLRLDGHIVEINRAAFSTESLVGVDVVVIANPSAYSREERTANGLQEYWWGRKSAEPALTDGEVDILANWVSAGGGLFLMIGHAPNGSAARNLVNRFGIDIRNTITRDPALQDQEYGITRLTGRYIRFSRSNGGLRDHPVASGRSEAERVEAITTYVGTSIKGPADSEILLELSEDAIDYWHDPPLEGGALHELSAAERAQGIALSYGHGRIVIIAETGLFTTGTIHTEDGRKIERGLGYRGAQSGVFARNIVRWLSQEFP